MYNNQKGLSLVQVLIAVGLLGGVSLIFAQLMQNMTGAQSYALGKSDEVELRNSIRLLLNDPNNCRVSLAGNGPLGSPTSPITFFKEDIDENGLDALNVFHTEGLDIELYTSNELGDARSRKRYNGEDNNVTPAVEKHEYGRLDIKTMKLIMPELPLNTNYSDSVSHEDIGIIRVEVENRTQKGNKRKISFDFEVKLAMSTSGGETTILSCVSDGVVVTPPSEDILTVTKFVISSQGPLDDSGHHHVECNSNTIASGFSVYASDRIDGPARLDCAGNSDSVISCSTSSSPKNGSANGQSHYVNCPSGKGIQKLSVAVDGYWDGELSLKCCEFQASTISNTCTNIYSDHTNNVLHTHLTHRMQNDQYHSAKCPANTVLSGIGFWSVTKFENIQYIKCCPVSKP